MPTKKERIESLEVDSQGLCDRLDYAETTIRELKAKIAELEKKLSGYWLVDKNSPYLVTNPQYRHCQWCGKTVDDTRWHYCPNYPNQWVNPIPWLTFTATSTRIETSNPQALTSGNSIVSNGVIYQYKTPEPEKKEGV